VSDEYLSSIVPRKRKRKYTPVNPANMSFLSWPYSPW